jgi:serine/threonine protein phosphatase PrpC
MSYEFWGDQTPNRPEDEYPNECSLGLTLGQFHLIGASVRGRMHIRNETPREDAIAVYHKGDWLAVAVSDGVGSSKYSRLGASCAVNRVCQNLFAQIGGFTAARKGIIPWFIREAEPKQEQLEELMIEGMRSTANDLKEFAESLAKSLERREDVTTSEVPSSIAISTSEESGANGREEKITREVESPKQRLDSPLEYNTVALNDLHCTLLVAILNLKLGTMALAQIGDGLILGLTGALKAIPLIEPQMPGQTGQTYVITQKDWERYCSVRVIPGERSKDHVTVYLMTDGVADDCQYGPPEDILQRWANDMDSEIRKYSVETTRERLSKYLNDYQVKGSYDDRTLVAVYRRIQ